MSDYIKGTVKNFKIDSGIISYVLDGVHKHVKINNIHRLLGYRTDDGVYRCKGLFGYFFVLKVFDSGFYDWALSDVEIKELYKKGEK